jgi:hypothetical protein
MEAFPEVSAFRVPEKTLLNHIQPFMVRRATGAKLTLYPLGEWFLKERLGS